LSTFLGNCPALREVQEDG